MPDKNSKRKTLSYADAGVDIERAGRIKERIKALARSTFNASVVGDIGSFGGLYRPELGNLHRPILVSSVDGVGTKLKIAFLTGIHDTVGLDIVAHCTNDILVQGAKPLFFMDYIASGRLEPDVIEHLVSGLAEGCRESGCALLGGETAEMPDFYADGEYDLAGFIVGVLDESKVLGAHLVAQGDQLIGLPSSGLHTNGYSLVRKLFFEQEKLSVEDFVEELGRSVGDELLEPHRNYFPALKDLLAADDLHALAHITGGGITQNLNRILPEGLDARVERGSWEILPVFQFIRERGGVGTEEMYRTFNMGIGMVLVVSQRRLDRVETFLQSRSQHYYRIGEVTAGDGKVVYR